MKAVTVSVPGKVHLIGEHVVVHGKPAIIAAIDRRCRVKIIPRSDNKIQILSKNFNDNLDFDLLNLLERGKDARGDWERFIKTKEISFLTRITKNPLDYPMLVVYEALKFYKISKLKNGFLLTIDSKIPIGSGNGSSAAIAVAIASAVTVFLGKKIDLENIFQISVAAEELKHGTPSGGDPATVIYGGLVWFQKYSDGSKTIKPLGIIIDKKITDNFYLVNTGKPEESTGEMIALVREYLGKHPKGAEKIFKDQELLTKKLLKAIEKSDSTLLQQCIKVSEKNLEMLGVVSEYVKKIVSEIEKVGGAAKISGGGGKKKGAGVLIVYAKDKDPIEKLLRKYGLVLNITKIGEKGLRIN